MRMFLPPSLLDALQMSQPQKRAGMPSAAALPIIVRVLIVYEMWMPRKKDARNDAAAIGPPQRPIIYAMNQTPQAPCHAVPELPCSSGEGARLIHFHPQTYFLLTILAGRLYAESSIKALWPFVDPHIFVPHPCTRYLKSTTPHKGWKHHRMPSCILRSYMSAACRRP